MNKNELSVYEHRTTTEIQHFLNSKKLILTQTVYPDIKTIVAMLLSCFSIHNNIILYYYS